MALATVQIPILPPIAAPGAGANAPGVAFDAARCEIAARSGVAFPAGYIPHAHVAGLSAYVSGHGTVGDKARELVRKAPAIQAAGLHVAPMYMLAEGFFRNFRQTSGHGIPLWGNMSPQECKRVWHEELTAEQRAIITMICALFRPFPLAARSSAAGDARGSGQYLSEFTMNAPKELFNAISAVFSNSFGAQQQLFRKLAGIDEGMAVFIQPVVGQRWRWTLRDGCFGPILSGVAYTSGARGEPFLKAEYGLAGAVSSSESELITYGAAEAYDWSLKRYVDGENAQLDPEAARSKLLGNPYSPELFTLRVFDDSGMLLEMEHFLFGDIVAGGRLRDLSFQPFFSGLQTLETMLGARHYVEFALTLPASGPRWWITQIAEVNRKADSVVFEDQRNALLACRDVTGAGERVCDGAVICESLDDLETLFRWNAARSDYLLLFASDLIQSSWNERPLSLEHFSNASVLIDLNTRQHAFSLAEHFHGVADMTGKFLALLSRNDEIAPQVEWFKDHARREDGLLIYDRKLRVKASEQQDRLVVYGMEAGDEDDNRRA
jgi:hypothetical protein